MLQKKSQIKQTKKKTEKGCCKAISTLLIQLLYVV